MFQVVLSTDQQQWNVRLKPTLDFRVVAQKVKKDMKRVDEAVKASFRE